MATAWSSPKTPPPFDGAVRSALASCTTGSEAATAGANDGLDCRQLSSVQCAIETAAKAAGTILIVGMLPGDTVTINGQVFTAVKQDAQPTNVQFKVGTDYGPDRGDDWITAANLAAAVAAHGVGATVTAYVDSAQPVVTVTALADGAAGNAFALATSSARAVLSGATLAGGLAAGVIGNGASLQFSAYNPLTGRWNRLPDLDQPLVAGLANQSLPALPIPAFATRLQAVPNNVGVACAVYMNGAAGRIP
jgi:hypothetical protein